MIQATALQSIHPCETNIGCLCEHISLLGITAINVLFKYKFLFGSCSVGKLAFLFRGKNNEVIYKKGEESGCPQRGQQNEKRLQNYKHNFNSCI